MVLPLDQNIGAQSFRTLREIDEFTLSFGANVTARGDIVTRADYLKVSLTLPDGCSGRLPYAGKTVSGGVGEDVRRGVPFHVVFEGDQCAGALFLWHDGFYLRVAP